MLNPCSAVHKRPPVHVLHRRRPSETSSDLFEVWYCALHVSSMECTTIGAGCQIGGSTGGLLSHSVCHRPRTEGPVPVT